MIMFSLIFWAFLREGRNTTAGVHMWALRHLLPDTAYMHFAAVIHWQPHDLLMMMVLSQPGDCQ